MRKALSISIEAFFESPKFLLLINYAKLSIQKFVLNGAYKCRMTVDLFLKFQLNDKKAFLPTTLKQIQMLGQQ